MDSITPLKLKTMIYIGASSIYMMVRTEENKEVDFLRQSFSFAHDIFSKGKLSKVSIERAVVIIKGYLQNLSEYGEVDSKRIHISATNILYEAENKENFITRIQIACNTNTRILDDGEMTRLLYLKSLRRLKDTEVMSKKSCLLVHVGPGNTRVIFGKNGTIEDYKSYRLGTFRTAVAIDAIGVKGRELLRIIRENSGGQTTSLKADFEKRGVEELVMMGEEIQLLVNFLKKDNDDRVSIRELEKLCLKFSMMSADQIVKNYPFDYHSTDGLIPALEVNVTIAKSLGIQSVIIPDSNYEKGLLADLSNEKTFSSDFESEVMKSAFKLAEKFNVHLPHAQNVCILCEILFESLKSVHQLVPHDLLLLRAAAVLHESGGFITPRAHHKHSMYLVSHSEIFGLSQSDVNLIALICRYHRNSPPKSTHPLYKDLSVENQVRVAKLASLIRVADALDKGHLGRALNLEVELRNKKVRFTLKGIIDASVERLAMKNKSDLFKDIFGLEIEIREQLH